MSPLLCSLWLWASFGLLADRSLVLYLPLFWLVQLAEGFDIRLGGCTFGSDEHGAAVLTGVMMSVCACVCLCVATKMAV